MLWTSGERQHRQPKWPVSQPLLPANAAKLQCDAGESIEAVSAFLAHSSLTVSTAHLCRREGVADLAWPEVAAAIGL